MAIVRLTRVLRHLCRTVDPAETAQTDGDLLSRYLLERDDAAFESLLERHGPMVLGVCRRILRNEADAHDAFQATFLVFVRKAASVHPRSMVGNWLYGVARKIALKARSGNRLHSASVSLETLLPAAPAHDQAETELRDLLDQELNGIPARYRAPVVLCGLEGRSLKEAARELRCPPGTVASRLARGRDLLARRLARQGLTLSAAALALALAREAAAAAVPSSLFASTAVAAPAFAVGQSLAAEMLSPGVARLTEGALRSMFFSKLQWITVVCLSVSLCGAGGAFLTYQAAGAEQPGAREQPARATVPDKPKTEKKAAEERTHGYLGVMLASDDDSGAVLVHDVFPDSPAAKAGVKAKDVILKINKTEVKDPKGAVGLLKSMKPGDKVTLLLKRGDETRELAITLTKWPADFKEGADTEKPAAEKARGFIGLILDADAEKGTVVVQGTAPDSPAAKAGIKEGDRILKVGKDEVKTAEDLIERMKNLKEGDKITLRIKRGDKEMDVSLTAAKRPADFGKM